MIVVGVVVLAGGGGRHEEIGYGFGGGSKPQADSSWS